MMELIDRAEFDRLVGHLRSPATRLLYDELSWMANQSRSVVGLVLRDKTDKDFAWVLFVREPDGYATTDMGHSFPSAAAAIENLNASAPRSPPPAPGQPAP